MKLCVISICLMLSLATAQACDKHHASNKKGSSLRTVSFVSEANASEGTTARFKVAKMSCESCQTKIENSLKKIEGVEKLTFDLKAKTVAVSYQAGKVTTAQITAALTEAGFPGTAL